MTTTTPLQVISLRRSRWKAGGLVLLLLAAGCAGEGDDDDTISNCSPDDIFSATACDEEYCGPAVVRLGQGVNGYLPLDEGASVPVMYGAQGGYHIDLAVEMDNFCPIVFIRPSLWLDPGDGGELVSIFEQNRHVQAVRVEPFESPLQQFWGLRAFIPCEHWPNDPDHPVECGDGRGSSGFIEDYELEVRVEVEDHNGRTASASKRIQSYCCDQQGG